MVHDRQAIAQDLGLLHVVGGQQHRAALRLEPADDVPQGPSCGRIEARRGLVEEDQLRVVDKGKGDGQSLTLAA
jgi:hypothetical protein